VFIPSKGGPITDPEIPRSHRTAEKHARDARFREISVCSEVVYIAYSRVAVHPTLDSHYGRSAIDAPRLSLGFGCQWEMLLTRTF
jgi:hypothetical protein